VGPGRRMGRRCRRAPDRGSRRSMRARSAACGWPSFARCGVRSSASTPH
jgi:hypothetical protein